MKNLVVGMIVLYTLTAAQSKSYGKKVLPSVVLAVDEKNETAELEVLGTGGLMLKGVKHGKDAGEFRLSNEV